MIDVIQLELIVSDKTQVEAATCSMTNKVIIHPIDSLAACAMLKYSNQTSHANEIENQFNECTNNNQMSAEKKTLINQ